MKPSLLLIGALWLISTSTFAQSTQTLIQSGAAWKYYDTGAAPASPAWKGGSTFDEAAWKEGISQLGYGNDGERTLVSYGPDPLKKYITTYFRKTVSVPNVSGTFTMTYKRDDGIVIYINGTELKREYMPAGDISYSTLASLIPESEEPLWKTVAVPLSMLRAGDNVIAAEVHQVSSTSSDIRFDLELRRQTQEVMIRDFTSPAQSTSLVLGPYLQRYSDDPTLVILSGKRSMTIRWSTNAPVNGRVLYKTATGSQMATPYKAPKAYDQYQNLLPGSTQATLYDYSVTLNNLEPGTPYSYTIESGDLSRGDATYYFKTAPDPIAGYSKKTRMWVLGDFGKGGTAQKNVRDGFNKYIQDNAANEADKYIDLWLWLGDNAYGWGLTEQYQEKVFDVYDGRNDAAQRIMRQTPIFATPGNHDYHDGGITSDWQTVTQQHRKDHSSNHYYDVVNNLTAGDAAGVHSGKEEYYSFDHNNIHFVSLDSYGYQMNEDSVFKSNGVQLAWLKTDLEKVKKDSRIKWTIVFLHHPPYSVGEHNSDDETNNPEMAAVRKKLLPILETYGVDLVLTGHSHTYQRSWPIRGHQGLSTTFNRSTMAAPLAKLSLGSNEAGLYECSDLSLIYAKPYSGSNYIVHVVNGSGGSADAGTSTHPAMQNSKYVAGSMYIEVEGNRLDARFIDGDGLVRDQFKIVKDDNVFTIPLTDGTTRQPDCECTDAAGFTHYVQRTPAGSTNLLLSIRKNGKNIGTVGDGTFNLQLKGTPGVSTISANYPTNYVRSTIPSQLSGVWTTMNRFWALTPTVELSGTSQVTVRHYYKEVDKVSLMRNGVGPAIAYRITNDNTAYTPDPATGHASIPKATAYNKSGAWLYDYGTMQDGGLGSWYAKYGTEVPNLAYWFAKWDQERPASSIETWNSRYIGKGNYQSEIVVGRLRGGGGLGGYNGSANPTGTQALLTTGSYWTYLAKGRAPGNNWNGTNPATPFDDAEWSKDPDNGPVPASPFGYSPNYEDGERTRVPACGQEPCTVKWWTTYFRARILLNDVPSYYNFTHYIINYKRDDGIVIYINGKEVKRDNMPLGTINYDTPASGPVANESEWQTIVIPNDGQYFKPGQYNLIAAEVHQTADQNGQATSSDMHFDLEVFRTADVVSSSARLATERVSRPEEYKVEAFPNPTSDGSVSFSPALPYQSYMLTDIQGRIVTQATSSGTLEKLDLSGLQPGLYILVSQGEYGIRTFKLVRN
ncbi:metallophosphoesterase [Fibrella sp. HMF5335]|uniref:Metallophosphoesterase n=1 Tax=Fibrella rubiginis TaxID=2817060 RepID=A0A939GAH7_9BACT|nr:metallophosphoesterase [Fibrella rubiginis]MBO0935299.1 metallophosphoesterase [Fibrella rubiginis]